MYFTETSKTCEFNTSTKDFNIWREFIIYNNMKQYNTSNNNINETNTHLYKNTGYIDIMV